MANSGDRRISFSGRIQYGQNSRDRPRNNQNYRGDFRRGDFRGNIRTNQNYRGQNYRGGYLRNYRMIIMKEVEVGIGIDNILIIEGMKEATVSLDQVQDPV